MEILSWVVPRDFRRGGGLALVALMAGALAAGYSHNLLAADGKPDLVAAHLEAGEFGPAREAAQQLRTSEQRDQALAQIATAQARAGARHASLFTAAEIGGDNARKEALDGIRSRYLTGSQDVPATAGAAARGGGVVADFDTLIELITTTVNPDSWDDVGGPGSIAEFPTGVYVDAAGVLRKYSPEIDRSLDEVRRKAAGVSASRDPRKPAILRKVSLTRLEREVQLRYAEGKQPDDVMQTLAGLQRIQYVLIYPESGDIVLAGPAGDWRADGDGRMIDVEKGRPVVMLDDLVVVLRNAYGDDGKFGCAITPTKEGLANAQAVADKWSKSPLQPGQRGKWLEELRSAVGKQEIDVYGIDRRTHAARVIVEADYRMKLVGMGLEKGTLGVTSYLDSMELAKGEAPPPMAVLRWWFTLNYGALKATPTHDAYALHGPGVKVLSENEMLTERGERVHTGKSNELNSRFAQSFTKHFETLAGKYPIYADLRNVFDLALVSALLKSEDLPGQVGWHLTHFGPDGDYQPALGYGPTHVETVINHRVINEKTIVAGVSGGVTVSPRELVSNKAIQTDDYGLLKGEHKDAAPQNLPRGTWWWD